MDTGPVLALEPLSTILPGNYRHLQHPQALDRPTLFLGDRSQEHTAPRRLFLGSIPRLEKRRGTSVSLYLAKGRAGRLMSGPTLYRTRRVVDCPEASRLHELGNGLRIAMAKREKIDMDVLACC
jgi:hypothetical protein